jgi:hypothetical protein
MGDREVPFDENEKCDICGKLGAFDFMGDLICDDCLDKTDIEKEWDAESVTVDAEVMRQKGKKMLYNMMPYLWYLAGSICFAVGTAIVIYRILKGA